MKKATVILLALLTVMVMASCAKEPENPLVACLGEDFVVNYTICSHMEYFEFEGDEGDELRQWLSGLEYSPWEGEGNGPTDDVIGGECYTFMDCSRDEEHFFYVDLGSEDFLYFEGAWYCIDNPSDPPLFD